MFHPPIHPKYFGGSVAVTIPIVNELAFNGHEVILLVADKIDQEQLNRMMGEKISSRVKVIFKPSTFRPRSTLDLHQSAFRLFVLKQKCDIVIDTYSNYVFTWTDVCYIHFPYLNNNNFMQHFPYLYKRGGLVTGIINWPHVFFAKNLEDYGKKLVLANSQFTAEVTKQCMEVVPKVLYPPVSDLFFKHDFEDYNKDNRENLVVTTGRITDDKKMTAIPQIAKLVFDKEINFTVIGFSHDIRILRKIKTDIDSLGLAERVSILTDVSKEKVIKTLLKAKVYLHPPTLEHFGISIAEAMALGCIPVVYDIGGVREFVPKALRYVDIAGAAERVSNAINLWSPEKGREMNGIVKSFSESNFRRNFIKLFSDYCSERS